LSDNQADWADFSVSGTVLSGTHVGWHFDLPLDKNTDSVLDGERVIKDVIIRDKKLVVITFTPNDSPCTGGGTSLVHEMDACDGSRLDTPHFDINMDGVVDSKDMILITDPNDPTKQIWVPPTGKGYDGLLHPPIIVTMPTRKNIELKIFSSSAGTTERLFEKSEGGFYYWRELKNN
jgi:type IV pilus assembly protein PilY1